jgi:casein kinase II subunit beta
MGQHDTPSVSAVKLYCAKCEDLYNPKSTRHASIDGAYFGTSFHNILFQVYPNMQPAKSLRRYEPKIFGFRVHAAAALMRWQDERRDEMSGKLKKASVEAAFLEDESEEDSEEEEEVESLGNVDAVVAGAGSQMQL